MVRADDSEYNEYAYNDIPAKECALCIEGSQHMCRICGKSVCVLFCSIQDPESDNEIHRIHKAEDARCSQFPCSDCGKFFKSIEEVNIHMESLHRKECQFECPTCSNVFSKASELETHMKSSHEQSSHSMISEANSSSWKYVECSLCKMIFQNESD